jgi:hypothetical protein
VRDGDGDCASEGEESELVNERVVRFLGECGPVERDGED